MAMLIGELAKSLSVTAKTLRHYESIGLVPKADRAGNSYRVYSPVAIARARLVVGLRGIGLSIEQIQGLLTDDGAGLRAKLLGLLDRQMQDYALQISILQGRHDDLDARYRALLDAPGGRNAGCACAALLQPCECAPDDNTQRGHKKSAVEKSRR